MAPPRLLGPLKESVYIIVANRRERDSPRCLRLLYEATARASPARQFRARPHDTLAALPRHTGSVKHARNTHAACQKMSPNRWQFHWLGAACARPAGIYTALRFRSAGGVVVYGQCATGAWIVLGSNGIGLTGEQDFCWIVKSEALFTRRIWV